LEVLQVFGSIAYLVRDEVFIQAADPIRLLGKHDPTAEPRGRQGASHTTETPADDQYVRFDLQERLSLSAGVPADQLPGDDLGRARPGLDLAFMSFVPGYHRS
jgi:hypothetical protein